MESSGTQELAKKVLPSEAKEMQTAATQFDHCLLWQHLHIHTLCLPAGLFRVIPQLLSKAQERSLLAISVLSPVYPI